ncbi:hypothetical protein CISIN_1g0071511mg, partial [Citrus sinensis]
MESPNLL